MNSKFKYYLHRVKDLPPEVALKKAFRKVNRFVSTKVEKYETLIFSNSISDEKFFKAVKSEELEFKSLDKLVDYFKKRREPKFFIDPARKDKIVKIIQDNFPEFIKETINNADQVCEHVFDLLGSGPINLKAQRLKLNLGNSYEPIDWQIDFKTGYRWNPKKYYKDINIPYGKADIKVPWELSRFQHLATLGEAYWIVGQKSEYKGKYAFEFMNQIEDWIENNPPKFGVNWKCTMDVAIRAANWLFGFYFFADAEEIPDEFWAKFLKSMFLHGRFIRKNLEIRSDDRGKRITGNHYLSDILGLIFLGIFFRDTKEGKGWLDFGIGELITEMEFQVYPDGVDFESSIPYHRLVLELFATLAILCKINDIELPQKFWERLEKMFEFVMYYTKPDSKAPQIGDNDDGRLHILANYGNRGILDHRYLLSIGAILFDRFDFREVAGGMDEEAFWLLGEEGLEKFKAIGDKSMPLSSKAFVDGGVYIMRHNKFYMIIDCIPNARKAPSHNSRLSFEIYAYNKTFLVDPGAYIYTAYPEWRNKFRSTAYHNTVVVDSQEQNRFFPENLFFMQSDAVIKVNQWKITDEYDFLDAQHSGYERLRKPVTHQRQILFNKKDGYWIVKDILTGTGEHMFDLYFHFAPMKVDYVRTNINFLTRVKRIKNQLIDGDIKIDDSLVIVTRNNDGTNLFIIPLNAESLSVDILDSWVSYSYGTKEKASMVKYSKVAHCPTEFLTLLYPVFMNEILDFKSN